MTDDELTELECAILDACEEVKRRGWKIAYMTPEGRKVGFVNYAEKCCCPIQAVLLCGDQEHGAYPHAAKLLGIPEEHVSTLTRGFDVLCLAELSLTWAWQMGARFRERVISGEL